MIETAYSHKIVTEKFTVLARLYKPYKTSVEFAVFLNNSLYDETEPEPDITGTIKWDGCMNWDTGDNCMYHFCDTDDIDVLRDSFEAAWVLSEYIMGDVAYRAEWHDHKYWNIVEEIKIDEV
jgi:hypothetical protein